MGVAASLHPQYDVLQKTTDALSVHYTAEVRDNNRKAAKDAAATLDCGSTRWKQPVADQLVYGELELETFAEVLQGASPTAGEVFLDIGSGAGRLVLGAACMHQGWSRCIGIELLPHLHEQAEAAAAALRREHASSLPCTEFLCCDAFEPTDGALAALCEADVVAAYAITWACDECGRLTQLSNLLGATLKDGARVLVVDLALLPRTPRLRFDLLSTTHRWNEETGMTDTHCFRATCIRTEARPWRDGARKHLAQFVQPVLALGRAADDSSRPWVSVHLDLWLAVEEEERAPTSEPEEYKTH